MPSGGFGKVGLLLGIAASIAALTAALALAAVGGLTPKGCVEDFDVEPDICEKNTGALDNAFSVAVSPDGTSVYATSFSDNGIVRFERDTADGSLKPKSCIDDSGIGLDSCDETEWGLQGAAAVAISPDGTSVYVASATSSAIVRFKRDLATGKLTPKGCIGDTEEGPAGCEDSTEGLWGAFSVAVSPDGTSVYAAGGTDDAIVRFERNLDNGKLTPKSCVVEEGAAADCEKTAWGINGPDELALSPDGTSVYVASSISDSVAWFERDLDNGQLKAKGCIGDNDTTTFDDCDDFTDGLDNARSVVVSVDGASVYAASTADHAVVHFERDTLTGALSPVGCVVDVDDTTPDACADSAEGLGFIGGIAISPDGESLYAVAPSDSDAIVRFKRNTLTGALTAKDCIQDTETGGGECDTETADGLNGARGVTVSGDNASVYVASQDDDAVVRFKRKLGP